MGFRTKQLNMRKVKLAKTTLAFLEANSNIALGGKYILPEFVLLKSPEGEYFLLDEFDDNEDLAHYLGNMLQEVLFPGKQAPSDFGINTNSVGEA